MLLSFFYIKKEQNLNLRNKINRVITAILKILSTNKYSKMKKSIAIIFMFYLFGILSCSESPIEEKIDPPGFGIDPQTYPCPYLEPSVSFDGSKILFYRAKVKRISKGGYNTEFDPDSTGFWVCNIDGSNMRLIYNNSFDNISNPQFTPNMGEIVFVKNAQICKAKYNGTTIGEDDIEQLTFEGRNFFPSISNDGNSVAFSQSICGSVSKQSSANFCGVIIANMSGENKELISKYSTAPDWHPTKQSIIFLNRAILEGGVPIGDTLWEYSTQQQKRKFIALLTNDNYDNRYAKYSPDGLNIAFTSRTDIGYQQIWLLDPTGKTKCLTAAGAYSNCSWTPTSRIVYIQYAPFNYDEKNGTIWIMDSDGGNKKQITFNHGLILE